MLRGVAITDAVHDRQAQPRADPHALGGEARVEDPFQAVLRDPAARVLDLHDDVPRGIRARPHIHVALALDGLRCVHQQVDQQLTEAGLVRGNHQWPLRDLPHQPGAGADLVGRHLGGKSQSLARIDWHGLVIGGLGEGAVVPDGRIASTRTPIAIPMAVKTLAIVIPCSLNNVFILKDDFTLICTIHSSN